MPTSPSTPQEFKDAFESWPNDSLAVRKDPLGPGSSWDIREIETFQIIRKPSKRRFPLLLEPYIGTATTWIEECDEVQSAIQLLHRNWRYCTHQQLSEQAGKFASFFTLLAQVLETPLSSDPRRELRSQVTQQQLSENSVSSALSSSSPPPPSLSSLPSSPIQPPNKKMRYDRSSESYIPSDQSDQSSHNHRAKSEITTNACVYELLRCVTELLRNETDPPVYLEWSITHDTFTVEAGALVYSTTNDGSLVHKGHRNGCWQRVSNYSYCSIEAKSRYDVNEKPSSVQAQEAAHLIGMFAQGAPDESSLQHETILPLISAAQNVFSLVLGKFPAEYARYLRDGYQSEDGVFVELDECGMFELQDPSDLTTVFTIIVALYLWLQSLGPKL